MALDPVRNFATCEVSTGYDAAATSIVLQSGEGAKLPAPATEGPFNLVWWNSTDYSNPENDANVEIVRATARSGDTLTVTRAQESTGASTKNTGGKTYYMRLCPTSKWRSDLQAQGLGLSGASTELTISSGAITVTQCYHKIDTEGDAATDTLVTINGGVAGQVCCFFAENAARQVVIDGDATGNIYLANNNDFWFNSTVSSLTLLCDGTNWRELARSSRYGWLSVGDALTYTVSSNTVTPTNTNVVVNTATAAQTINTITAMPEGTVIVCRISSGSYSATWKDAVDNLYLAGDFAEDSTTDTLVLYCNGSSWLELSRSNNG